ncbi:MAG TPA: SDR family oxidoreductase, partial [Hyphomicrobiales bacterium]|nr:SDR family oxidoreductase [Hyphomicrobiales bacterium]
MTALDALSPDLFEDRKVLVTGAGRGIGRAVAAAFATLGAHVLAHLGTTERGGAADVFPELSDGARGRISMMTADLATIAGAEAVIAAIVAELGGLDILVNNAGTMHGRVMASDMTAEHYARVVDLNARSV